MVTFKFLITAVSIMGCELFTDDNFKLNGVDKEIGYIQLVGSER